MPTKNTRTTKTPAVTQRPDLTIGPQIQDRLAVDLDCIAAGAYLRISLAIVRAGGTLKASDRWANSLAGVPAVEWGRVREALSIFIEMEDDVWRLREKPLDQPPAQEIERPSRLYQREDGEKVDVIGAQRILENKPLAPAGRTPKNNGVQEGDGGTSELGTGSPPNGVAGDEREAGPELPPSVNNRSATSSTPEQHETGNGQTSEEVREVLEANEPPWPGTAESEPAREWLIHIGARRREADTLSEDRPLVPMPKTSLTIAFDEARSKLKGLRMTDTEITRAFIRWRKRHDATDILKAVDRAFFNSATVPCTYIEEVLTRGSKAQQGRLPTHNDRVSAALRFEDATEAVYNGNRLLKSRS